MKIILPLALCFTISLSACKQDNGTPSASGNGPSTGHPHPDTSGAATPPSGTGPGSTSGPGDKTNAEPKRDPGR